MSKKEANAINLTLFQPENLTAVEKTRLNTLLDELDQAAAERNALKSTANNLAMQKYLSNPAAINRASDQLSLFNAMSDERFTVVIETMSHTPEEKELVSTLKALPIQEQKQAMAFMQENAIRFVDKTEDRKHWKKIDHIYETILSEFPNILATKKDIMGAVTLGYQLRHMKGSLQESWAKATTSEKIDQAKSIISKAYPDDQPENMQVVTFKAEKMAAAFISSVQADTMACGQFFSKMPVVGLPLYFFIHEFQHRRQLRLVQDLKDGKLEKDTAEYYQARLFRANFNGGYLSPTVADGKLSMIAGMRDYQEQPVERHANLYATVASSLGETRGDTMWAVASKINLIFSDCARPIDNALHGLRKIVRAITPGKP